MSEGATAQKKPKKEKVRDLKVRLHDASAREQLMMIGSKLANAHMPEFPEMLHLFPDLHLDATSCRAGLVRCLFSKPLHYLLLILLAIDVLTVVVGLQLKIEVASLEGMAVSECLGLTINASETGHHSLHLQTFETFEEARECVEHSEPHQLAETIELVDHVLAITSICILAIFLLENLCFLMAFRCSYFKVIYFPLDLFVVLVSLITEVIGVVNHFSESVGLNPTTTLGTASSMMAEGFSPVAALMIIGRFWRFARIGHAVYLLQESEDQEENLQELNEVEHDNGKENCEVENAATGAVPAEASAKTEV